MIETPFKYTPVNKPDELVGYGKEKQELKGLLSGKGILLLLSDEGYGKSSLAKVICAEEGLPYIERCTREKLNEAIRSHVPLMNLTYRLFGDPTDVINKPIFVDECAPMNEELASIFNNLYDRNVKVVLIMTHTEKERLRSRLIDGKTLFDRATKEYTLNGFSKESVALYIKKHGENKFDDAVIEEISARYRKPRDVAQVCNDLWEKMVEGKKDKITIDMLPPVQAQAKSTIKYEIIGGEKMQKIFDYISKHPGAGRADIASELKLNPNSAGNLLAILMKRKVITKDEQRRYYASTGEAMENKEE